MFKGYGMVFDIYMETKARLMVFLAHGRKTCLEFAKKSKAKTGLQNLRGGVSYRDGKRYIDVLNGMSRVVREENKKGVTCDTKHRVECRELSIKEDEMNEDVIKRGIVWEVKKINYIERLPELCKAEGLLNVEVAEEEILKHFHMELDNVNKSNDEEVSNRFNDDDEDDIDDEVVGRRQNGVALKVVEVARGREREEERERGREREEERKRVMRFNEKWPRESWGVGDLWRMFKGYGMVFDIYMDLLDKICWETKARLMVFLAHGRKTCLEFAKKSKAKTGLQNLRGGVSYRDGKRYIDVLNGMSRVVREENKKGVTCDTKHRVECRELSIEEDEMNEDVIKRGIVWEVKKINYIERLPELCKAEGLLNVKVVGMKEYSNVLRHSEEEILKHFHMEVDNVNKSNDKEVSNRFNDDDEDDIDDEVVGRRQNGVTLKVVEVAVVTERLKVGISKSNRIE
nr:RNA-directed DNA polymerase, eukaryota [Tanacetum cinerariifolium]